MEHGISAADGMKFMLCFFLSVSFSGIAPGTYRQVPAPLAQRCGAEELHEYSGESGTER